jgi:hypothetical protein
VSKTCSSLVNVAVGGPQAVGKSSALRALAQLRPEFDMIFFGEQLPSDFLDYSQAQKDHIRTRVAKGIASKMARGESVTVIDMHYLDLREPNPRVQRAGFLSCFNLLVFFNAPPEVLLVRRVADTSRPDRPMALASVRKEVDAHLEYFKELASHGTEAILIDCQRQPIEVAKELARHIDRLLSRGPEDTAVAPKMANWTSADQ